MKVLKALTVNDPHISRNTPKSRIDDYTEACFEKINWCVNYANNNGFTHMFWTGDFFHEKYSNQIPHRLTNRMMDILESFTGQHYAVAGNHDEVGMSPESIPNQPIYSFTKLKNFTLLDMEGVLVYDQIHITGSHFYFQIDRDKKGYYPNKKGSINIHLTHGHLVPSAPFYDADYTLYSDIADTQADIIYNGHIHYIPEGDDIYRVGNTVICNSGSLTRGSLSEDHVKRSIYCIATTVAVNGGDPKVSFERVPVECAKPADKIFDLEQWKKTKEKKASISVFADLVREKSEGVEYGDVSQLRNSVMGLDIEDDLKQLLIGYLDRAEASLAV